MFHKYMKSSLPFFVHAVSICFPKSPCHIARTFEAYVRDAFEKLMTPMPRLVETKYKAWL